MIIDFGRLGPESFALLRALFCVIDQLDKWVVADDADDRIVTQVSLPIWRHNLTICGCVISWGAMRARTAGCGLHPSRARRVWIGGQGTHRFENKRGRTTERSAGVCSNGHEVHRRVFYLGKVHSACYCASRTSHEPFAWAEVGRSSPMPPQDPCWRKFMKGRGGFWWIRVRRPTLPPNNDPPANSDGQLEQNKKHGYTRYPRLRCVGQWQPA